MAHYFIQSKDQGDDAGIIIDVVIIIKNVNTQKIAKICCYFYSELRNFKFWTFSLGKTTPSGKKHYAHTQSFLYVFPYIF